MSIFDSIRSVRNLVAVAVAPLLLVLAGCLKPKEKPEMPDNTSPTGAIIDNSTRIPVQAAPTAPNTPPARPRIPVQAAPTVPNTPPANPRVPVTAPAAPPVTPVAPPAPVAQPEVIYRGTEATMKLKFPLDPDRAPPTLRENTTVVTVEIIGNGEPTIRSVEGLKLKIEDDGGDKIRNILVESGWQRDPMLMMELPKKVEWLNLRYDIRINGRKMTEKCTIDLHEKNKEAGGDRAVEREFHDKITDFGYEMRGFRLPPRGFSGSGRSP